MNWRSIVIFGRSGFIGSHFARFILSAEKDTRVYLADLLPPDFEGFPEDLRIAVRDQRVKHVALDVRRPIRSSELPESAELVLKLAAIHREPGHKPAEYFETNLLGAKHVCEWAEHVGCHRMVFASSISPYGPSEDEKTESSLPVPETPYGASKLAAEKIHMAWQRGGVDRRLLTVRPGVVFVPGEGGNVTRLVKALSGRYFFIWGIKIQERPGVT